MDNIVSSPAGGIQFGAMPASKYGKNSAWKLKVQNAYFKPEWPTSSMEIGEFKFFLKM